MKINELGPLAMPNEHTEYDRIGFTGTLYFNTNDAGGWWDKLKDVAKVCYGIENFEHGTREFAIYDNNGYMLQFGTEIPGG